MIFSAFEIMGNVCVAAAFIIFPGNNLLTTQYKGYFLILSRSAMVDLHHLHGQGDVVEVGVCEGGQEADAQTDRSK